MKIDENENIQMNWFERKISNPMSAYVLLFGSAFGTAYFYYVNQFLPTAFSAGIVKLLFMPMLVGSAIGVTFGKYMEVKLEWRKRKHISHLKECLKRQSK